MIVLDILDVFWYTKEEEEELLCVRILEYTQIQRLPFINFSFLNNIVWSYN